MTTQLFSNNAYSVLNGAISDVATAVVLTTGTGSRFPSPSAGDWFLATLIGLDNNGVENAWEIVKCTARSSDTLTVTRAQEGTSAVSWISGTHIELRDTAARATTLAGTSGTNTGDNSANSLYSGLVTNATHTGDVTGSTALTVVKINGTLMSGLATGILKNTTSTGVPSIAVAADFPSLNQDTTGYASALKSATTTVSVAAATAPTVGQALVATSGTTATWQLLAGGLAPTAVKTGAYNAVANDLVRVNSTGGAFTVTLPASSTDGDKIGLLDVSNTCGTNAVLIAANGNHVEGDTTGMSMNLSGAYVYLLYNSTGTNWKIEQTPNVGAAGAAGTNGTNGTNGVDGTVTIIRSARTSNTILGTADAQKLIDITSGTFTQTFTAAATLASGWFCYIRNSGTGDITLDPNGAETIDGQTSYIMYPGEIRLVQCDGAGFYTLVLAPFYRSCTSTFSFVMPPGYTAIGFDGVGGGGGGGSGRRGAAGTDRMGGGPGGAPGRAIRSISSLAVGSSTTVTIGASGTGGAVQTADDTNGVAGTAGGNTSFGTLATAYGGALGAAGTNAAYLSGVGGSGSLSAGGAPTGGKPFSQWNNGGSWSSTYGIGEGGSNGGTNSASLYDGTASDIGGAGSGAIYHTTPIIGASGSSFRGVSAASPGGSITTANATLATKKAGLNGTQTNSNGATAGVGETQGTPTDGTAGAASTTDWQMGNPGAGGGATLTMAAKAGGAGGFPGGPGGGGGASTNGYNSGKGGDGAAGRAIIWGIA